MRSPTVAYYLYSRCFSGLSDSPERDLSDGVKTRDDYNRREKRAARIAKL